jgi:hypothetical protein
MQKDFESLGTVNEVRERAQEVGLPITAATQLREISPRCHLDIPLTVRRPSTVPMAYEESELVYLTRPLSQQTG